jgi:hypothetical protein
MRKMKSKSALTGKASKSLRRYERPRLYLVKLADEEGVLRACKTNSGSGSGPMDACRTPSKCYAYGS